MLTRLSGPSFYKAHTLPEAPCPLCCVEKDDSNNKTLFQVDDFDNGQFHSEVPKDYFEFPPSRLGDNDPGMQALRVSVDRTGKTALLKGIVPIRISTAFCCADEDEA